MKNKGVTALVLLLSLSCCLHGMLVKAEEPKVHTEPKAAAEEHIKRRNQKLGKLQIPQKLGVVIDPWEMDERGQIYSEQYVIRNNGNTPGILTLSDLVCKAEGESGVIVAKDRTGLHDDHKKSIYMQMVFGNGDRVALSRKSSAYEAELQPGEELLVWFEGEVNENASEGWKDGDVAVTAVYSWSLEQMLEEDDEKKADSQEDCDSRDDVSQDDSSDMEDRTEEKEEEEQNSQDTVWDADSGHMNESPGEVQEDIKEQGEEETAKEIGLKESGPVEFAVEDWKTEDDGQLCSVQYLVRNEGKSTGVFTLSDLSYLSAGQNKRDADLKLMLENGEEIDFAQKVLQGNSEENGYQAVLEPGEELKFRFAGRLEGVDWKELQKGEVTVQAAGSWEREEIPAK